MRKKKSVVPPSMSLGILVASCLERCSLHGIHCSPTLHCHFFSSVLLPANTLLFPSCSKSVKQITAHEYSRPRRSNTMDSFEAASFLGIGQSGPSTHINDGIRGRARRLMDASASSLEAVESLFNYATSGIPRPSGISRPEYYSPRRPNDDFSSSRSTLTSPSSLDEQAIDLEGGRQRLHSEWSTLHRSPSVCSWLAGQMYGPRLEERLRNPAIGGQAKYSLYDTAIPLSVFARFLMMVAWCVIILYYHSSFGVECKPASHEGPRPSGLSHIADRKVGKDLIYAWAQAGLATGSVFLLSHAYLK